MSAIAEQILEAAPRILRCQNGGWLAVSPDESPVHIGVFAWSADEARNRFTRASKEWAILADAPEPS